VYGLAYRLLGDAEAAQDVTQEVFLAVFQSVERFRLEARLTTWLLRITTNRARNKALYLARRAAAPLEEADGRAGQAPNPEQALLGCELEAVLQRALAHLDVEARALVVLRDVEGLPYQEITQITGLADGTVKSKLHRARLQLKAAVGAYRAAAPTDASPSATPPRAAPRPPVTAPVAAPLALATALHAGEPHHD
jgi:RNA polymerase sigma-70 factor (ECF subfamily)